jgi:L-alanine-DL-glutamate epimerase-like enolase superfamily enzyme
LRVRTKGGLEGIYGAIDDDALPFLLGPLRRVVLGQDALAVEALWDRMYRADRLGRSGRYMKGISYLDNALWDLRGRHFNAPVYQLLGGPARDPVRAYGSCLGYSVQPDAVAKRCVEMKELGFTSQKWFFAYGPADGRAGLQRNVELVRVLRESLGGDVELLFDAFQGWDLQYALAWAQEAESFHPSWLEEAFPVADLESFIQFSQRTSIPVATGEHFANRWEVQQFLKAHALQYVQADPEWCGGVSELVKICHLASVHGVKVVPHGHNVHAALHVVASQSPAVCPQVEYLFLHMPSKLLFQKDPPIARNGVISLPQSPGFGIELDENKFDDQEDISEL